MQGIKNITTIIIVYILFIIINCNNRDYFASNSAYHSNYTRQRNDLHLPQVTLAKYQKNDYYSGIKTFSSLPTAVKDISSKPYNFKIALKHDLHTHSLYTSDEFCNKQ